MEKLKFKKNIASFRSFKKAGFKKKQKLEMTILFFLIKMNHSVFYEI
jgi:hypothetical protein